jgi:hypothetical protein
MRMITRVCWSLLVATASVGVSGPAGAQGWGTDSAADDDDAPKGKKDATAADPSGAPATEASSDEAAAATSTSAAAAAPEDATEAADASSEPSSASNTAIGVRYRGIYIPQAVLGWFVEGGDSVYVNGFGPELALRDDNVEYVFSAWLALYQMDPVAIKGASDAEEAWEIVESDVKALYLTADYLWHKSLASQLELTYGGSVGLGFLFGNLYRTQATLRAGGTAGNPDDYVPCTALNNPAQGGYCDDINDHYDGYAEPNWFHGGSKPALFPWITGQVGLRYQPHEKLVTRLDLGLGSSGLFFGIGVDYAL